MSLQHSLPHLGLQPQAANLLRALRQNKEAAGLGLLEGVKGERGATDIEVTHYTLALWVLCPVHSTRSTRMRTPHVSCLPCAQEAEATKGRGLKRPG